MRESMRRTPPELVAAEVQRQTAARLARAQRDVKPLLEPVYRDDIREYMHEMEVSSCPSASRCLVARRIAVMWGATRCGQSGVFPWA